MKAKRANGDGTIFSVTRADGTRVYKVEITLGHHPDGRPKRTRRTAASQADARRLLKELHAQKLKGTASQITATTVLDYGLQWIRTVKAHQVKPTTAADYEDRLRRTIGPWLGKVRIIELTPQHVERWMANLRLAGMSVATVNGARQVLHGLCKHAARTGVIPHNPVANTDPIKRQSGEQTRVKPAWSSQEVAKVLHHAVDSDALDAFLHLMLHTGMRPGEALGLRWCDVDLTTGSLQVTGALKQARLLLPDGRGLVRPQRNTPKTTASIRTLSITSARHDALARQQMRQGLAPATQSNWSESGYVITTKVGTPVSTSNIRRQFTAFLSAHGIRQIRLHDMRHTIAVLALNDANVPLEKVSQALGHDRIDTTKRIYARNVPRYNEDFAAALGSVLPSAPKLTSPDVDA